MNNSTRQKKLTSFDPNHLGLAANQIFGLPFTEGEATTILFPVPWDVTVSYGGGSSAAPQAILEASRQVDLFDPDLPDAWQRGIALQTISAEWAGRSAQLRTEALRYINFLEAGGTPREDPAMQAIADRINAACGELRAWVAKETGALLEAGKLVGLLGGDHSTPLGFLDALAARHAAFGILQIDAHCDLRQAYEGFQYSHASVMCNALTIPQVTRLVQVGIRDFCEGELGCIESSAGRVQTFFDHDLTGRLYGGESWHQICRGIIEQLPPEVYVSFDIDGLDPKLCPNTGTPVPGGLEFQQALYLLREVVRAGRRIIGFDLNEVCPGEDGAGKKAEWDANVGARLLYKLCNFMVASWGR